MREKREFLEQNRLRFLEDLLYEDVYFTGLKMFLQGSYYHMKEPLCFYYRNHTCIIHSTVDTKKVRQGVEVMFFLTDLYHRGILKWALEKIYYELDAYCLRKSFIDPALLIANRSENDRQEELVYLKERLLHNFPNAHWNSYFQKRQGKIGELIHFLEDDV